MSKYGNRKTWIDNIDIDSQAEAQEYRDLKLRLYNGEIRDLECHSVYPLVVNGIKVAEYEADFRYTIVATGAVEVVDVKSSITAKIRLYRLKNKLMRACHGITIKEVLY